MKSFFRIMAWKVLILLSSIICFTHVSFAQTDGQIEQYIETYKSIAEKEMIRTGVPAAISLAQGIVESQAGTGWLAVNANNQFGIKCKPNWIGPTVLHNDDAPNECFRAYGSPDSSWRDHSDFLRSSSRYSFLFSLDPLDYKAWAHGLKRAGYATSDTYAQQLINTIQTWNLEQYSEQAYVQMQNTPKNAFEAMLDKKVGEERRGVGIFKHKYHAQSNSANKVNANSPYPEGLFQINEREVIYLHAGTQLISIAEKYHIRLSRLVRLNDLKSDVINNDMLIYLQKKKKTGAHETHIVKEGETLHEIAQEEGIQLKWLCKRNRINNNVVLLRGEVLYLHGYAPKTNEFLVNNGPASSQKTNDEWKQKLSNLLGQQNKNTSSVSVDSSQKQSSVRTVRETDPSSTQTYFRYEVKQGDTLYNISKRYGVTVEQIQQWNKIEGTTIKIGQSLIIRNK